MDTTSNRLCPQSIIPPHTQTPRHTPQKLTLRRRCRSECLQMPPVMELSTEPRPFDDLNDLRRKVAQPVFRNMLLKYSPTTVMRKQDNTTKNIFSFVDNRRNGALLKNSTKENISAPNIFGADMSEYKDLCMRDFKLYKERAAKNNQDFITKYHHGIDKDGYDNTKDMKEECKTIDNNKRRARARSESEPHEIYQQINSPSKNDKCRGYDLVLKRSREDQTHSKNGQELIQPDTKIQSRLINPHHTKIVTTHLPKPCTQRYPIKQINGNRKLKSRNSLAKCKQNKSMVVSNPPRCPTPTSPALTSDKLNVGEESDTGCSSLEDDDDFDDVREADFNDSLSDSEDSSQTQNTTSLDKKISVSSMTTECVIGRYSASAPLSASLFPHVPPYITFASHAEKGPPIPPAVTKVLKWKLTTITPIVIRKVLLNTGFRLLRKTNDWMGVWGKHMKSPCFKTIRSYQKINHIPGTFQIGRKDRIWRNLQVQIARHGKKEFGFMPRTYIIPNDIKLLRKIWPKYSQRNVKWIIKPPASARGTGIKVVNRWSQIPKRKPFIVQRYIDRPMLINGSKFDLRLYVLVTSINPLRVYMHTDGLARFASVKYSEKSDTLNDRYMHLTNYSINKLSTNYAKNEDANACKGHKWTVKSLWTYLASQGINVTSLWSALRNLVLRTILAGENAINQLTKMNMGSKYNCYELFGIDVILDSDLIPWLLEVNISPSLHSASPLDLHVKGPLVRALLNTSLFQVPPRIPIAQQREIIAEQGLTGNLCFDKRIFVTNLSKNERIKHNQFINRSITCREDYLDEILKSLTPDDVRTLLITEDELARSAPLERIFPSSTTYKYLHYTENPRYYNRLLDAWEHRYGEKREEGIQVLRKLCESKLHLSVAPQTVKKDCENNLLCENSTDELKLEEDKIINKINDTQLTKPCEPKPISNGHALPTKIIFSCNGQTTQNGIHLIKNQ